MKFILNFLWSIPWILESLNIQYQYIIDSLHFWNTDAAFFEKIWNFFDVFFMCIGYWYWYICSAKYSIYLDIAILIFIWTSGIWLDRIFELIDYFIDKDIYSFKFILAHLRWKYMYCSCSNQFPETYKSIPVILKWYCERYGILLGLLTTLYQSN